ncbi:MAG: diguanylate cyclase [Gammaproteobacteria bacterium]|nr:diguanylate cyclase [Gammaproteobacteria bacterium]
MKPLLLQNAVLAIIFISLSLFAYHSIENNQQLEIAKDLEHELSDSIVTINNQVQKQLEDLRAIASFVSLTTTLTPTSFENYAMRKIGERPEWDILEWQPIVRKEDRTSFEENIRSSFYPNFRLWEPDDKGEPRQAAVREEHVPVLFMVSKSSDTNTRGLDLAWSVERMESKWSARDTGNAQLSGLFDLVTSDTQSSNKLGYAITLPVYSGGITPTDLYDKQKRIIGYIAGVYSINNAFSEIITSLKQSNLKIEIVDTPTDIDSSIEIELADSSTIATGSLTLLSQNWQIKLIPNQAFFNAYSSAREFAFIGVVIGCWFLLSWFLFLLHRKQLKLLELKETLEHTLHYVRNSKDRFKEQARRDALTKLLNKQAFIEKVSDELGRAVRFKKPLCLLMIDLDHFKKINDTYGHVFGDEVLKSFAETFSKYLREQDVLCRYGGEEFALIMIETTLEEGDKIANRLFDEVRNLSIFNKEAERYIHITCSGGLAQYHQNDSVKNFIKRADEALYRAKRAGRKQICLHQ